MSWLHIAVLAPFLYACIVPLLHKSGANIHTGWFVLPLPAFLAGLFLTRIGQVAEEGPLLERFAWIPSFDIGFDLALDGLSLLFAVLISGIGALVVLYSIFYLDRRKEALGHFYAYILMFMGAMLGVVLSDHLVVLYMFWEFTSISSFLLIAYWSGREKSRYGAQKSMLITVFGGMSMLAGIVMLYAIGGTFSIRELIDQVPEMASHDWFVPSLFLMLLGAFTKSAQFPFHIWLPDAMEAPTPVSAYLHSATMVKAGIYLVARLTPIYAGIAEWFWLVAGFGLLTLFWGSFQAIRQTDLKSILAFSTVSQLGLIMCLLGIGSLSAMPGDRYDELFSAATFAALFHLLNHAKFKGSLFMVAGIVDHETGTRDIRKLGGLMSLMPVTFTIGLIGALSMAGLPPFNGFLSKEMFFTGVLEVVDRPLFALETWGLLFPAIAWTASVFTFVYSLRLVLKTFTGKLQTDQLDKHPHEAPVGMLIPPIVLASLVVLIGFYPNVAGHYVLEPALHAVLPNVLEHGGDFETHIAFWHGWTMELWMTIGVIALGTALLLTISRWIGLYERLPKRLALNRLYDGTLIRMTEYAGRGTSFYMTGSLRDYLLYIFLTFLVLIGGGIVLLHPGGFELSGMASVEAYEVLLAVVTAGGAAAILLASSRISAILAGGAVGYMVSLFFVIMRAPDLALTQLVVETVSVALFLLCFYHLPKLRRDMTRIRFQIPHLLVALGVGSVMTFFTLAVQGVRPFDSIADYFLANSYKEGGGDNVVNVILVDFRGFDTMLEILVLGIASLAVYALIKLRLTRRERREHQ